MSTLIQLKRSLNTAVPVSLANGEFAWSSNSDVAYFGANGAIVAFGGRRIPGVLTANQAMVTNSSSFMDVVKTANLYIGAVTVNAINITANSTQLGANSNSELATTAAIQTYVTLKAPVPGGANTFIEFNDSGLFGGSGGLTFNKTTNAFAVGNTVIVGGGTTLTPTSITVQDMTLSGNLTVTGTLTTIDAANIKTKDTLIELGDQNLTTDLLSLGIFGDYGNTTITSYAGLFRDQLDLGKWKLFTTQSKPTTIVDTANTTYAQATLQAYLVSSGLVTNSTVTNITANSTVSVALVANTLSLSTALSVLYGGTGLASVANNGILVGNTTGPMGVLNGVDGQVLQYSGTSLVYSSVDCGVF